MTSQPAPPTAEDYLRATEDAFSRCPNYSGLRLISAEIRHGYLSARFEGPLSDFRGPYGARVILPTDQDDTAWVQDAGTDPLGEWVQAAVVKRALDAHAQSLQRERGYTTDDVWWLVDDSAPGRATLEDQPSS